MRPFCVYYLYIIVDYILFKSDGRADLTALNFDERKLLAYGNSKRKYCCHECYIQDRFRTSQDAKITDAEIKRRQELAK